MNGIARHGRFGWIAAPLMALALLARMLVPAGFMPAQGTDGVTRIVMCSGSGPMTIAMPDAMIGKGGHHPGQQDSHDGDHACPFSGFAALADAAHNVAQLPLFPIAAAPLAAIGLTARPGLGLAAPPPPKTGPPLILR